MAVTFGSATPVNRVTIWFLRAANSTSRIDIVEFGALQIAALLGAERRRHWHQTCIPRFMTTDLALKYLGTAVELAGINQFYTRRVLQRCERGEITLLDAAELLMAAVKRNDAGLRPVAVGKAGGSAFPRAFRS